jgi:hypothetical protein
MNKWITDRLPTENDADENGHVWVTALDGGVHRTPYVWVPMGVPWMAKQKIVPPEPYVKPDRWKPKCMELYWTMDMDRIKQVYWLDDCTDEKRFADGNCFQTEVQAIEAARRMRETLLNYHKELNNAA